LWNFLLRGSTDKLLSMTAVVLGHIPIALLGLGFSSKRLQVWRIV